MNDYIETAKLVIKRYYDEVVKAGKKLETFRVTLDEFSALLRNNDLDLVETIGGDTMYFLGFGTRITIAKNADIEPFTITKEQYDKDIAQAKKDAVIDHCKKVRVAHHISNDSSAEIIFWHPIKS